MHKPVVLPVSVPEILPRPLNTTVGTTTTHNLLPRQNTTSYKISKSSPATMRPRPAPTDRLSVPKSYTPNSSSPSLVIGVQ